jgi:hypothetical protein
LVGVARQLAKLDLRSVIAEPDAAADPRDMSAFSDI